MLLGEPGRTEFDFNFNILGFDVRVHPGFFIISLLFGRGLVSGPEINTGVGVLMGIAIFFVSILVHELGHSLAFRRFGLHSRIVLHWMGGLAIPEQGIGRPQARLNNYQAIFVSLAGPVAGLLLGFILILITKQFSGGVEPRGYLFGVVPIFSYADSSLFFAVMQGGILVNIFLNLINLVPIFPLDGGQVSRNLFEIFDRRDGTRKSLMLSMAAAVLCGVLAYQGEPFIAIFCFYMAYQNYQMLSMTGQRPW